MQNVVTFDVRYGRMKLKWTLIRRYFDVLSQLFVKFMDNIQKDESHDHCLFKVIYNEMSTVLISGSFVEALGRNV